MQKAYDRTYWENYPSDASPINETNLNKLSGAVDEIDDRVITLDITKATKTEVSPLFSDVAFDEGTGIITFTRKNGAVVSIDTKLEKLAVNFAYDPVTEQLIITLDDGEKQYADLSALITQYEFLDSDTIGFQLQTDGSVKAIILNGSITEDKLRPDYLADIKAEAAKAETSALSAGQSASDAAYDAKLAQSYAVGGSGIREGEDEDNAKKYKELAAEAALTASEEAASAADSADQAGKSAGEAALSEENSADSEANAKEYAEDAETAAINAESHADTAADKAIAASQSAVIAGVKADNALDYSNLSKSYAVGTNGDVREGDDSDCSEYYYNQCKRISQGFNGIIPMGNITFSELDDINNQKPGYMFNLSDSFTSDERFKDGGDIFYGAGSNVIYTADGMWDVLAASMVSGVKGDTESEYRQGFVNITSGNIGALALDGDSKDNTISFTSGDSTNPTAWTDVSVLTSGEKHSSILNKISVVFKNLRYLYKMLGTTDISALGGGSITGAISTLNTGKATKYTNRGSATHPVYIDSNGVPTAISYTIAKSVPSNAVFTDTNTWRGIQNNLTSTSTTDSLSAYQGKLLNDKISDINTIKTVNLSVTTDAYGQFVLWDYYEVLLHVNYAGQSGIYFILQQNACWFRVFDIQMVPITNTTLEVRVYYATSAQ